MLMKLERWGLPRCQARSGPFSSADRLDIYSFPAQCSCDRGLFSGVFVKLRCIPLQGIDFFSLYQSVVHTLLDASACAFCGALVLHHMFFTTHRIADDPGERALFRFGIALVWRLRKCAH